MSEGRRHIYESEEVTLNDQLLFTQELKQRSDKPVYLVSHSLGGLVSCKLAAQNPTEYAGMSLIAPYFGLKDPKYYDKYKPGAAFLNWTMPTYKIKAGSPYPDWLKHFVEDPLYQGQYITGHNLLNLESIE